MDRRPLLGSCVFCRILEGQESAEIICEGTNWLAFFPLRPATPGHTLVIPREHVEDYWAASPTTVAAVGAGALRVGRAIQEALAPAGMNLITSAGTAAEQTVFHLHIHVVPRWPGDGFDRIWPPSRRYENAALENVAGRVRQACEND